MNTNEYLARTLSFHQDLIFEHPKLRPQITCADGFTVSIQASVGHYCTPRENLGPYSAVEAGYPSEEAREWHDYAEDQTPLTFLQSVKQWFINKVLKKRGYMSYYPTCTVYPFVPVELIDVVLERHGGIVFPYPVDDPYGDVPEPHYFGE